MTRETKIGLVVACSFLCLVGVVVASKLRGSNEQNSGGEQQEIKVAAAKENANTEKKDIQPKKSAKDAVLVTPTQKKDAPKAGAGFAPIGSVSPADIRFEIPPQPKQPESKKDPIDIELARLREQALAQNTPMPVPAPITVAPPPKAGSGLTFPPIDNKGPTPITITPPGGKEGGLAFPPIDNKGPTPITITPPAAKEGGLTFPPIDNKGPTPITITPPGGKEGGLTFPPIDNKGPMPITVAPPAAKEGGLQFPPLDKKDGGGVTFPPIGRKDGPASVPPPNTLDPKIIAPNPIAIDGDKTKGIANPITGVQPIPAAPVEKKDGGFVFPPITNKQDNNPPPITDPTKKPFAVEPPPTVPPFVDNGPPPMFTTPKDPTPVTPPKGPTPTIPNGPGSAFDLPSTPPIGTTPPNFGIKPTVKETQPDSYFTRAGETNFNVLSARIYQDDRYAAALLAYNRRYRTIIRNGENLALDPPVLPMGQEILYPNKGILERDFANLIPGLNTAKPTIPAGNGGINITKPAPLGSINPVSNPPIVPSGRTYVVQNPNGESILDIAERTLGNRSRWNEIYNLNTGLQPQFRIPAGAQIKLP